MTAKDHKGRRGATSFSLFPISQAIGSAFAGCEGSSGKIYLTDTIHCSVSPVINEYIVPEDLEAGDEPCSKHRSRQDVLRKV